MELSAIAIHYLTQRNADSGCVAIAILKTWVGCDHKQKIDILNDRQFNIKLTIASLTFSQFDDARLILLGLIMQQRHSAHGAQYLCDSSSLETESVRSPHRLLQKLGQNSFLQH